MVSKAGLKKWMSPIAVVGLGKSGSSAVRLLKAMGYSENEILTYDDKDSTAQFNSSQKLVLQKPNTLVVSPGVPLKTVWIQDMLKSGVQLTSEISLAVSVLTSEKIIGVTGSVGKSTVVSILGAAAHVEDPYAFVGGNLGTPFCEYALSALEGKEKAKWIVLELSSYQLENCEGLQLEYSVITFLSPNHLERYDSLEDYYQTKMLITKITRNSCVINATSHDAVKLASQSACPVVQVNSSLSLTNDQKSRISLIGSHNHDNFAVAKTLAELARWKETAIEKMYSFGGLSHRLENVGLFAGVRFINDSKATAMDSVLVATAGCVERLTSSQRLFLLLGGKDKNLPWEQLAELKNNSQIHPIFFGACGELAKSKSGLQGPTFQTLGPAVETTVSSAQSGDIVLLSPGGTSLDEFKNFEERGNYFKEKVKSLLK